MDDYIAQFSTLRLKIYPKPVQGQSTQSRTNGLSQFGYFLISKGITLHYPVRTANAPMVRFFLETGAHKHLSLSEQIQVYDMAVEQLDRRFHTLTLSEIMLKLRSIRCIVELLNGYGFRDAWLAHQREVASDWMSNLRCSHRLFDWLSEEMFNGSPHPLLRTVSTLTEAVWDGDADAVQSILRDHGTLCVFMDEKNVSALNIAVLLGDRTVAATLLSHGSSPCATDFLGQTSFNVLTQRFNMDMLSLLYNHGPCFHHEPRVQSALLPWILEQNSSEALISLLDGCSCAKNAATKLCEGLNNLLLHGSMDILKTLLDKCACLAQPCPELRLALDLAVVTGGAPRSKILLEHHASAYTTTELVYMAGSTNNLEVSALIASHIKLTASEADISLSVLEAIRRGDTRLLNALLDCGAPVEGPRGSEVPLQVAVEKRRFGCIKPLLEHGALLQSGFEYVRSLEYLEDSMVCRELLDYLGYWLSDSQYSRPPGLDKELDRIFAIAVKSPSFDFDLVKKLSKLGAGAPNDKDEALRRNPYISLVFEENTVRENRTSWGRF